MKDVIAAMRREKQIALALTKADIANDDLTIGILLGYVIRNAKLNGMPKEQLDELYEAYWKNP